MKSEEDLSGFSTERVEASDWLTREEDGLTEAEQHSLHEWLKSPKNAEAYRDLRGVWGMMDRMSELPRPSPRPRIMWRWVAGWGVAASLIFVASLVWRNHLRMAPVDLAVSTEVGKWRTLDLPEGSTIRVNTDSRLTVRYTGSERHVTLTKGEAHFTVAKDASRPFTVEAGSTLVRALGTAFNVRLGATVDLIVTEGTVRLDSKPAHLARSEPVVTAGQRVTLELPADKLNTDTVAPSAPPTIATVTPAEVEQLLSWREERLKFAAAPLATIVAEFNRYNAVQFVIEDPSLAAQRFGGTFRPDRPETLVGFLEQTFGVLAENKDGRILLRRKSE